MNAAPPVFHAPPQSDVVQPDAPTPAASTSSRLGSQDFAAALSDAGAKPARKSAANKQQSPAASGSSLPAPGNQPPPALNALPPVASSPPPAKTDSLAAAAATAAKGIQGSAQGAASATIAAGPRVPAGADGAVGISPLPSPDPGVPESPAPSQVPPDLSASSAPSGVDAAAASSAANDSTAIGSGMSMPHALSMRTLTLAGASKAAAAPAAPTGNAHTANSNGTPANAADNSTSASSGTNALNDSALNTGPAAGGTDAASQAAMAAAAVQGTNAPLPDTASSEDSAIAESGGPQGAASSSDPAAGSPAAAFARASAASVSAAATAAAAASVTQVLSDAAAGATDKRSHANSPDATLAGASNDGSAGAAQLLSSNTSTDTAPSPTFKVAAGVDTAQFGQGVADRVSLMMDGNLTSAKLQVNPPALGPIEVRIALQGGHAQVWLSSHSAVTRDALESSSPKLREMLGSQGFSQVSVDISHRSFQERSPPSQAYESSPSMGEGAIVAPAPVSMSRSASALLDAYA